MARELEENRASIRQIDKRLRDMEEAIRLLAQEQRHGRELETAERDKLFLRLQQELTKAKELPSTRGRKKGRAGHSHAFIANWRSQKMIPKTGFKIVFTDPAIGDFGELVAFIARDNFLRTSSFTIFAALRKST